MKKCIKSSSLLSTFLLPLGMIGAILATEQTETPEALQQKLQILQKENQQLEANKLQQQIKEEEKRKKELTEQNIAQESQQQSRTSAPDAQKDQKSKWVRERNRFENQAQDKVDKLKNLF